MACFSYDANGRLTQAWDPRPTGTTCGTPVLPISYGYDAAGGRLTSVTPAGLRPWAVGYDAAGRLAAVSRSHGDGSGTETTTLQYGALIGATTTDANPDLSVARVGAWGQQTVPVTAVAIFEPGDNTADLRNAEIHALDGNGREINTADFSGAGQAGWKIDTTEYDRFGNTVRTLSARNRDLALTGDPVTLGLPAGSTTVEIARALDETNIYTADGVDLTDTYGPWHHIAIDGGWIEARAHSRHTYGQLEEPGADPTVDGPKHAIVEQSVAASRAVTPSPLNETDARTIRTRFALSATDATGWTFFAPMSVTTEMGADPDIVVQTRHDAVTGQVIEDRQPAAAGTTASPGTTKTTYYTTGAHNPAGCTSSAWYGLPCKIEPGAQPTVTGLPQLPVKTFSYNAFLRPTVVTETVVDAGGTTRTRTTTTTYENSGNGPRMVRVETTDGLGTAVPATTTTYDPATGLPTATATATTPAAQIATGYVDFGRTRTLTDADGATTDTTYNPTSGDLATITWKDPAGATLGSQTFGYDGGGEHRGLTTSITDSGLGGAITAAYDADEALITQTMPNSITATYTVDPAGDTTKVSYAKAGTFWFDDRQDSNIHGQWRWHVGPAGWEAYSYDPAGRLAPVWDQRNGQPPCVQRAYTLDPNSNRTALRTWPADGNCPPATTPATTSYSYDTADRLQPTGIAAGLTYDAFGRTTTLPAALAGGTTTSVGYHTTDMVATQTRGATTRTWTLDPSGRLRTAALTGQPTRTNHYGDTGDAPAWIDEGDGARTRYVTGLDGNLAATITYTGTTVTAVRYQLTGLHGDVITTTSPGAATPDGAFLDYDEYGNPRGTTPATRYGWLGGKQRSSDALAGLILMGARLYHPTLGRFLQVDPIPGGNANAYTYPTDPVNLTDLLGTNVVYGSAGRAFLWVRRMGGHWYVNVGFALYSGYYAIWARVVIFYWARNGAGAIWRWYWLGWRRTFERNIRLPDYLGGPVSAFGYILAPGYGWTWWYGWYPVLFYSKFMYDRS